MNKRRTYASRGEAPRRQTAASPAQPQPRPRVWAAHPERSGAAPLPRGRSSTAARLKMALPAYGHLSRHRRAGAMGVFAVGAAHPILSNPLRMTRAMRLRRSLRKVA